jgi:hypothetical protein
LVTLGQDLSFLPHVTRSGDDYTAADVVNYLLAVPQKTRPDRAGTPQS